MIGWMLVPERREPDRATVADSSGAEADGLARAKTHAGNDSVEAAVAEADGPADGEPAALLPPEYAPTVVSLTNTCRFGFFV